MARPQLSSLLEPRGHQEDTDRLGAPQAAEPPEAPAVLAPVETAPAAAAPSKATTGRPRSASRPRATKPAKQPATDSLPPYLRFERKEARLRTDQLTALTVHARQLNKSKDPDSDRITDNTLIRIAVDLLLSRADELAGGDEASLRRSLGI